MVLLKQSIHHKVIFPPHNMQPNTPPSPAKIDVLIDLTGEHLFLDPFVHSEQAKAEKLKLQRILLAQINNVGNQQKFMMYWLLQMMEGSDQRQQILKELLPHCGNAMKASNEPRVKLAAAQLLYESKDLTEAGELQALSEAEAILHKNPDALAKDGSLRSLVYWAICVFSHNEDDIHTVLHNLKNSNRNTQILLATGAMNNLPCADICSIVEEQKDHLLDEGVKSRISAEFCGRGIRRLAPYVAIDETETEHTSEAVEKEAMRAAEVIDSLMAVLVTMPEAAKQLAGAKLHLALLHRRNGDLAEALELIQEARAVCPTDEKYADLLNDIDLTAQNIVDDMRTIEGGDSLGNY